MIIETPDWVSTSVGFGVAPNGTNNRDIETTASTVYEPAEDTFLVLDALQLDFEQMICERFHYDTSLSTTCEPLLVVELGSGAGLLSAAVAKILRTENAPFSIGAHCIAVDLNPAACHATAQTCRLNNVQVDIIHGDLLTWMRWPTTTNKKHLNFFGLIDVLLFNPPYVRGPEGESAPAPVIPKKNEITQNKFISTLEDAAWLGGGPNGIDVLKRALHQAADHLSERGIFYVLMIDYNYAALVKEELLARRRHSTDISTIYPENSEDFVLLTTFGHNPKNNPLACRRLLSRHVPGEKLAVYRVYRPHVLDFNTKNNVSN